jgi:hypothetical protein
VTPYFWRLCCLSLASLFIVQASAGLAVRSLAPRLIRWAARFDPARSAMLILTLRWLPGVLGLFVTGCLCIPSYLRLEPVSGDEEEIGYVCLACAGLAVLSYAIPMARTIFGIIRSELRLNALLRDAEEVRSDVSVIRKTSPAMALVGLFRSRVLVSREVKGLLNGDQMDAALRHERAHRDSGDNYKRLLLEVAPIDGSGRWSRRAWSRFTEWAADDRATERDSARSVALASALVSVARLTSPPECVALDHALLLVSDGLDLRIRVERLLEPEEKTAQSFPTLTVLAMSLTLAAGIVTIAQQPFAAALVHQLLEALID